MKRLLLGFTVAYILLTVALTWPVTARLNTHVPFYNDTWIFLWDLYWFQQAATDAELNLYHTPLVFHPHGSPLAFHTLTPANGLLALPLLRLLGLVTTHNLLFLASFVLSALAMAVLAFGPALFAFLLLQKYFVRGITIGGLKG